LAYLPHFSLKIFFKKFLKKISLNLGLYSNFEKFWGEKKQCDPYRVLTPYDKKEVNIINIHMLVSILEGLVR
jgi:hypothetical protein